jgi:DNA repair photolyase
MIISASRRTDIPAFYAEWFMNRLREGFVYIRNPMNYRQVSRVVLTPAVVDCIVFWTKNPSNMLNKLDMLDAMGFPYYFEFTITPYDRHMEGGLPEKAVLLETFKRLSAKIGKERVVWRYDPIIINKTYTVQYHLDSFGKMCDCIGGYTSQCIFSFLDIYAKNKQRLQGVAEEINSSTRNQVVQGFSEIAFSHKLSLAACTEKDSYMEFSVLAASCIDQNRIERIVGYPLQLRKDANQRPDCGCAESIDIGAYNCCGHGCLYCYANNSLGAAKRNIEHHHPHSPLLLGHLSGEEIITVRKVKSNKIIQSALF